MLPAPWHQVLEAALAWQRTSVLHGTRTSSTLHCARLRRWPGRRQRRRRVDKAVSFKFLLELPPPLPNGGAVSRSRCQVTTVGCPWAAGLPASVPVCHEAAGRTGCLCLEMHWAGLGVCPSRRTRSCVGDACAQQHHSVAPRLAVNCYMAIIQPLFRFSLQYGTGFGQPNPDALGRSLPEHTLCQYTHTAGDGSKAGRHGGIAPWRWPLSPVARAEGGAWQRTTS